MKSILLITATITTITQSAPEYTPNVPPEISDIFQHIGASCTISEECDDLYTIPSNMTAAWICANATATASLNDTVCQFFECDDDSDCQTDEKCYIFHQCDDNNTPYDDFSTICYANDLCNTIKTESPWTSDTMCLTGSNDVIYYSKEEAIICDNVCTIEEKQCKETDCISDKTCCTKDGWDESACLELLITEYIIYTIVALAVLLLCCCGCCCCIYKSRKKSETTYDEMDNQTNHYNVYI